MTIYLGIVLVVVPTGERVCKHKDTKVATQTVSKKTKIKVPFDGLAMFY